MRIDNEILDGITGGTSSNNLTGTVINAITNIIKVLLEAGKGVGESIRRIQEDAICPLE